MILFFFISLFVTGNADSFSGVLSEKKKLDDVVSIVPKQIFASDGDEGKNAEIIYSFKVIMLLLNLPLYCEFTPYIKVK